MASDINAISISGRLGGDAELRDTTSGTTVCSFTMASADKYKEQETTTWVRGVIFGKRGPAVAGYLTKGREVTISGKLRVRDYDKRDGTKGRSVEVLVDQLKLGPEPRGGGGGGSQQQRPQTEQSSFDEPPADAFGADDDSIPF